MPGGIAEADIRTKDRTDLFSGIRSHLRRVRPRGLSGKAAVFQPRQAETGFGGQEEMKAERP